MLHVQVYATSLICSFHEYHDHILYYILLYYIILYIIIGTWKRRKRDPRCRL